MGLCQQSDVSAFSETNSCQLPTLGRHTTRPWRDSDEPKNVWICNSIIDFWVCRSGWNSGVCRRERADAVRERWGPDLEGLVLSTLGAKPGVGNCILRAMDYHWSILSKRVTWSALDFSKISLSRDHIDDRYNLTYTSLIINSNIWGTNEEFFCCHKKTIQNFSGQVNRSSQRQLTRRICSFSTSGTELGFNIPSMNEAWFQGKFYYSIGKKIKFFYLHYSTASW